MKKSLKRTSLALLVAAGLLLAIDPGSQGQTTSQAGFREQVDRLLKAELTPSAPGAAVVVAQKGKPIFKQCCGLADVEHTIPITPKTRFNLASVAKQFTAFSVLLLEKEGKLSLDDDVRKFLPALPDYSQPVTIRHLLNQTSGIWEYYSTLVDYSGYDQDDHFTLAEDMELLKRQKKLLFEPGSRWSYSNTNYLLLAQVVEKVTGTSFQEWTKRHIFEALKMNDSFFMKDSSQVIPGRAEAYRKVKDEIVKDSGPWVNAVGMGYLFTTLEDMILWMDNFRTMKVGGEGVIRKMFERTKLNDGRESFYGYGLGVSTRFGRQVVGHSGQTAGYKTAMLYCPEMDLGITVLANERTIDAEGLANTMFDLFVGKGISAPTAPGVEPAFLPFDPASAARFAGGYVVENANLKFALNVEDGYLHGAAWGMGEDFFYPLAEKKFSSRSRANVLEFSAGEGRPPDQVTITIGKNRMIAKRIDREANVLESLLPDYTGSYYSDTFSIVYTFRIENSRLVMHHRRYGDLRIEPIDKDEFFFFQGFVKFNRDENGKVMGFTLTPSDEKFFFQNFEFRKIKETE